MLHPSETGQKKNFQGTKIILKGLGAHKKRLTEVLCAWANQKSEQERWNPTGHTLVTAE